METYGLLSSGTNILDRRRRTTDLLYLITLQFFILLWVSIAAYAHSVGDITKVLSSDVVQQITNTITISRVFIVIGYSILAGIFVQLFLYLTALTKIGYYQIICVALSYGISAIIISSMVFFHFMILYITLAFVCSLQLMHYLFRREWIDLPAQIIDESIKAIHFFRTPMLFSIVWYILCLLPLIFGLVVQVYLMSITESDGVTVPGHVWFFSFVNIISCAWLFLFLFNTGQMALCGTYAIWYWTEDKHNISLYNTIFRCLKITVMYHLGTVAYGSSLFGISRTLSAMLKILIQKLREGFNLSLILLVVYNVFDMVVCRFMMYSTIVACAVHGKRFSQSIEDSIYYFSRKPVRCLLVFKVTDYVLLTGVAFTCFWQVLAVIGYILTVEPLESRLVMVGLIILGSHIFVLPMLAMLFAASNTIFLCFLEDSDKNDGTEDQPYAMSPELQTLIADVPPPVRPSCFFAS